MRILREDTLVGHTIQCQRDEDDRFMLTINKGGMFLYDGNSEIPVEIGENGFVGNNAWLKDVSNITDREAALIYEIGLYQYAEFQRALEEDEEHIEEEQEEITS